MTKEPSSWWKELRYRAGLNRTNVAAFLGVTVSTLKSIEVGIRECPRRCLTVLIALVEGYNVANTAAAPPAPPVDEAAHRRKIEALHTQHQKRLDNLQEKLQATQAAYASACYALNLYAYLREAVGEATDAENQARLSWLQRRTNDAQLCLEKNAPDVQALLTIEIAARQAMVDKLAEALI